MAKKWIVGNWLTGNIKQSEVLPIVDGDTFESNVNASGQANFVVSRNDLPDANVNNWYPYLKPNYRFVAIVDDDKAWNDAEAIGDAFYCSRVNAAINDTIEVLGKNLANYLAVTKVYPKTTTTETIFTNPTIEKTFTASTWQGVVSAIIQDYFNKDNYTPPFQPPNVLGSIPSSAGTGKSYVAKLSANQSYWDIISEIRDTYIPGNEVYFKWVWTDSSKTQMKANVIIGTDAQPHIQENIVKTIDATWGGEAKVSEFSIAYDGEQMYNRFSIQSKAGDEKKKNGADLTVHYDTTASAMPLRDLFFNPGVELTETERNAQIQARFNKGEDSSQEVALAIEEVDGFSILSDLGKTYNINAGQGLDTSVRVVSLHGSMSNDSWTIDVLTKAEHYPRLPSDRNTGNSSDKNDSLPPTGIGDVDTSQPDDWDSGDLPDVTSGTVDSPIKIIDEEAHSNDLNRLGFWGPDYIQGFSPDGPTVVLGPKKDRFFGLNIAYQALKSPELDVRASPLAINIYKSMIPANYPDWDKIRNNEVTAENYGLTGSAGSIGSITKEQIQTFLLSDSYQGYPLNYENLMASLYIHGSEGSYKATVSFVNVQQLQDYQVGGGSVIRSTSFAFTANLDDDYFVTGDWVASNNPLNGVGAYSKLNFYAPSHSYKVFGDKNQFLLAVTPQVYPVLEVLDDKLTVGSSSDSLNNQYWIFNKQGAYSTWNVSISHDFSENVTLAYPGPSLTAFQEEVKATPLPITVVGTQVDSYGIYVSDNNQQVWAANASVVNPASSTEKKQYNIFTVTDLTNGGPLAGWKIAGRVQGVIADVEYIANMQKQNSFASPMNFKDFVFHPLQIISGSGTEYRPVPNIIGKIGSNTAKQLTEAQYNFTRYGSSFSAINYGGAFFTQNFRFTGDLCQMFIQGKDDGHAGTWGTYKETLADGSINIVGIPRYRGYDSVSPIWLTQGVPPGHNIDNSNLCLVAPEYINKYSDNGAPNNLKYQWMK